MSGIAWPTTFVWISGAVVMITWQRCFLSLAETAKPYFVSVLVAGRGAPAAAPANAPPSQPPSAPIIITPVTAKDVAAVKDVAAALKGTTPKQTPAAVKATIGGQVVTLPIPINPAPQVAVNVPQTTPTSAPVSVAITLEGNDL